jgi:hypothetical protein
MAAGWQDPVEAFFQLVEGIARTIPGIGRTERVPGDFALRIWPAAGGEPGTLFLHNLYRETAQQSPEARAHRAHHYLASFAQAVGGGETAWQPARARLLPAIRHVDFVQSTRVAAPSGDAPRILNRPFVAGVAECAVIDDEATMSYATEADAARWQVPFDAVFAEARQNLWHRAYAGIEPVARGPYTLLHVAAKDDYESSRAVLPGWLASFAPHVQGTPICAFPERSVLFVTGDGNPMAVAHLLALAQHHFTTSPRSISPLPYVALPDGRLVPLQLHPSHPSAPTLMQATQQFAARLPM